MLLVIDQKVIEHDPFPFGDGPTLGPTPTTTDRSNDLGVDPIHELRYTRHGHTLYILYTYDITILDPFPFGRLRIQDNVVSERIVLAHLVNHRVVITPTAGVQDIPIGEGDKVVL
jgi:hypothetical protein